MVQVLYLLEVFILAHFGPPSTETPTTTIEWCHKKSWIYLTSTYYCWLFWPMITVRFDSKFQLNCSIWFKMKKNSYSNSTAFSCSRYGPAFTGDMGKLWGMCDVKGRLLFRDTLGDFTFWLSPWLSLLVEPKSRLSRRWAKKWSRFFRLD